MYGGAKSRVVTISLSPQGGAYTRALESVNHYPRPSPWVGEQWIQMTGALMTLIEAVAAVLSKYMTIWPREVDAGSA